MKFLAGIGTALLITGAALAQHSIGSPSGFGNILYPGTGRPPVRPGFSGFGNIAFPGTGHAPQQPRLPFSITDTGFANRLGGIVSGFDPYRGSLGGRRGTSVVYMPYAYPVYVGGYDMAPQQPSVVVVYPQAQAPVVINQQFQHPAPPPAAEDSTSIKVYEAPSRGAEEMAAAAAQPSSGYLFAFKDHSIYSAVAYWIDGDTLHYFTSGNVHNQVSTSLIDRPLTLRLNRERGVDVRLPDVK
ncbi:MAG: hypothetical protein ACE15B_04550 [Bryobacteraceae bacterium]